MTYAEVVKINAVKVNGLLVSQTLTNATRKEETTHASQEGTVRKGHRQG